MANNRIQVKRTNVSGRTANVTNSGNTQFIDAGEFALNMADSILYTSNGSALITVGANNTNVNITGNATIKAIIANGAIGSDGQVLTSNGSTVYWSTVSGGSGTVTSVGSGNGLTGGPITTSGTLSVLANTGIVANATGVFVNATYIGTISANNASFLGDTAAASYLRSDTSDTFSGGTLTVYTAAGATGANTGAVPTLQIYQPTEGTDSFLTFHSNSDYAFHFGLDSTTNDLFVGGWSAGAVKNKVWHAGNDGMGSGLDADTLDGVHAVSFQTTAGLSSNVATLAANSATFANSSVTNTFTVGTASYFVDNGNLGVGIASPLYKLDVAGVIRGQAITGSGDVLIIGNDTKLVDIDTVATAGLYGVTNTQIGSLKLGSNGVIISGYNGNFGVGTTTPAYTLQVNGSFAATGTVSLAPLSGNVGIGNSAPTHKFSVNGTTYLGANVTLNAALIANGAIGSDGQVLTSNGSTVYWSTVSGGSGITAGKAIALTLIFG